MIKKVLLLFLILLFFTKVSVSAQPKPVIVPFASGFTRPLKIVHAGDSRLYVAEVGGKIKVIKDGSPIHNPAFLNITSKINNVEWAGIYSIAFHPNYETNGYFYVFYLVKDKFEGQLSRFKRSGNASSNIADDASETPILTIPFTDVDGGHRGGDMAFGKDNHLYVSFGDNGPGGRGAIGDPEMNSQNMNKVFGKVLRIDVDSPSPGDNILQKIWARGLRNPWRFSFDRLTGDFWLGDNGQDGWEEINFLKAGDVTSPRNFGWDFMEGNAIYRNCNCDIATSYIAPKFVYEGYTHNGGQSASVMGGYVYRGSKYASLKGCYIFGDYQSFKLGMITPENYALPAMKGFFSNLSYPSLASFGEDNTGELYTVSFFDGTIGKITLTDDPLPVKLESFTAKSDGCFNNLSWKTTMESNFSHFEVERSKDGIVFEKITAVTGSGSSGSYHFTDKNPVENNNLYRLKMIDKDASFEYSRIVSVNSVCPEREIFVSPNPATERFKIRGLKPGSKIEIYNASGILVRVAKSVNEAELELSLKGYISGIYSINVENTDGSVRKLKLVKE